MTDALGVDRLYSKSASLAAREARAASQLPGGSQMLQSTSSTP